MNIIQYNKIYNTEYGTQNCGIYLSESDNNRIYSHTGSYGIYNNDNDGIYMDNCINSGITNCIDENKIYENGENGIHFKDTTYTDINNSNSILCW